MPASLNASEVAVGIQDLTKAKPRVYPISVNQRPPTCWPAHTEQWAWIAFSTLSLFLGNSKTFPKESERMEKMD